MNNYFHIKSIVLVIISIIFVVISCKKDDKNIIKVEGKIYDPNTKEYVEGAKVVLAASKLSSGGIFSSGYENIVTMTTDASGTFACEFKEDKYAGYRITITKDHYFGYTKDLTTSEIVAGTTFSPTYSIYPECFIRMEIHNEYPESSNDHVSYSFTSGYSTCSDCCDNTVYHGSGMTYADTIFCKTYGNQDVTLSYNVTKSGSTILHKITHFCPAFDTTNFMVAY